MSWSAILYTSSVTICTGSQQYSVWRHGVFSLLAAIRVLVLSWRKDWINMDVTCLPRVWLTRGKIVWRNIALKGWELFRWTWLTRRAFAKHTVKYLAYCLKDLVSTSEIVIIIISPIQETRLLVPMEHISPDKSTCCNCLSYIKLSNAASTNIFCDIKIDIPRNVHMDGIPG